MCSLVSNDHDRAIVRPIVCKAAEEQYPSPSVAAGPRRKPMSSWSNGFKKREYAQSIEEERCTKAASILPLMLQMISTHEHNTNDSLASQS